MHIHNVKDYAPAGHKLLRTEYADGGTRHVFADESGKELVCEVKPGSADEERAALEAFRAEWTPLESKPVAPDDMATHLRAHDEEERASRDA